MSFLIITDNPQYYNSLQKFLLKNNYNVIFCGKQEDILSKIEDKGIKFIVMDLTKREIKDFALLKLIKNYDPLLEVIIIGDTASSEKIGESIRLGASEYITKPLRIQSIELVLKRIKKQIVLRRETLLLEKEISSKYLFQGMVGKSPHMLDIFSTIERIAKYTTNVLITGKTGTGKEMVARAIHQLSSRSKKKLIICDCSVVPKNLFESELFGYVRGAFTGADKTKKGLFEEVQGGTLFLDEIGNLPLFLQPKLLRVIEERQFRRLGSNEDIHIDVRLISATGRDLKLGIKNRNFREDLFHRLNILEINLPALKDRKEDIPLLMRYFLEKHTKKFDKNIRGVSRRVQKILLNYSWPGNIRELENVIEHTVALCLKTFIDIDDLPKYLQESQVIEIEMVSSELKKFLTLDNFEKQYIKKVLEATQGNIQRSAQILGISRYTLYRKIKKLKLSV